MTTGHEIIEAAYLHALEMMPAQRTGLAEDGGWNIELASAGEMAAYNHAVASHCAAVSEILDGKDCGAGLNSEPWGAVRKRLLAAIQPSVQPPVAHLKFWAWQHAGSPDSGPDQDEGYVVCLPTEKGVDGSPAFPVYRHPKLEIGCAFGGGMYAGDMQIDGNLHHVVVGEDIKSNDAPESNHYWCTADLTVFLFAFAALPKLFKRDCYYATSGKHGYVIYSNPIGEMFPSQRHIDDWNMPYLYKRVRLIPAMQ